MDGWEGFISWFSNYKPDSEWHMIFQSRCTKNFWGSDNQIEFIICHAGKDVVLFEPCCIEMLKKSLLYNEPLSNITEVSPSVLNFSIVMLSSCCTSSLARITAASDCLLLIYQMLSTDMQEFAENSHPFPIQVVNSSVNLDDEVFCWFTSN